MFNHTPSLTTFNTYFSNLLKLQFISQCEDQVVSSCLMARDKWLIFCMCCVPSWLSGIQVTERSHRGEIGNPISISRSPYGIEKEPIINSENYTVGVQWMNKWELFCVFCLRNTSKKYNKLRFITGWSLKAFHSLDRRILPWYEKSIVGVVPSPLPDC